MRSVARVFIITSLHIMYLFIFLALKNNAINTVGAMEGDCITPFYHNAYNYSTTLYIEPRYAWPIPELVAYICSRSSESGSSCQHDVYNVHLFQILGLILPPEILGLCRNSLSWHDELKIWQQKFFCI